ncbi:hypothetical protein K458DRAFT_483073 [Lentithecium fluviatile CBS 122367]|uniref:Integral membrane protein-like protein n=1 Tax=Lentithecium fluviatile CBS 122367 TaxID=1168545 RepID=A0A6G1JKD4_9PLEO|nr:hypothetical protein K458DRAFT_483073 [Lentithecium fluviatile CBS 122367]
MNEKITLEPETRDSRRTSKRFSIKPDIGDLRESTFKALPKPPTTPKSATRRFRVSAVLSGLLAIVSFVLSLLVLIAGKEPGYVKNVYLVKMNTTEIGQNFIQFDAASSTTSIAPTATTSSSSNPLDPLNPFSTASPLNPNNPNNPLNPNNPDNRLSGVISNLTASVNDGLGDAVNQIVSGLVDQAEVKGVYFLHLNRVCVRKEGDETDGGVIERCVSYDVATDSLHKAVSNIPSSLVIGLTNISVPLIANVSQSTDSLFSILSSIRRAILAFLILSAIGSGLTFLFAIPSVLFSHSHLFVYANLYVTHLASTFAFLAALLLTVLIIVATSLIGRLGEALGLVLERGPMVLTFVWISWAMMALAGAYWGLVWFVEVRRWSFMKRVRTDEEVGNWRGMRKEVWTDLKGKKSL